MSDLLGKSFRAAPLDVKHRLILAVDGLEKHGKTSFGLSAPGPIVLFNFDYGLEGVVQKYAKDKKVYVEDMKLDIPPDAKEKQAEEIAGALWRRFRTRYLEALKLKARSIVWDTGTEVWELLRLSQFGALTANAQHYARVNPLYRELLREANKADSNLIILHQLTDEWETVKALGSDGQVKDKGRPTGQLRRAGFKKTGFLVHANCRVYRDKGGDREFHLEIQDCRQDADLAGQVLDGKSVNFKTLAMMVFPESDSKDWR